MGDIPLDIWAEQDERESRLMIKIGDDAPVCVINYSRALRRKTTGSFTGLALTEGDPPIPGARDYIGVLYTVAGEKLVAA